jgi:hypothetical protein
MAQSKPFIISRITVNKNVQDATNFVIEMVENLTSKKIIFGSSFVRIDDIGDDDGCVCIQNTSAIFYECGKSEISFVIEEI